MEQGPIPSFPAGTRREEVAQARREMMEEYFKPEFIEEVDIESRRMSEYPGPYNSLSVVLREAFEQASAGKGRERHASGEPFERQTICQTTRAHGIGFATGQAEKKARESHRLLTMENGKDRAVAELLGAINYLAAAIIVIREGKCGQ